MNYIEWRDEAQEILESAIDQTELSLNILVVSDDLQGQQYMCRAESVAGRVYNEAVEIQVFGKFL